MIVLVCVCVALAITSCSSPVESVADWASSPIFCVMSSQLWLNTRRGETSGSKSRRLEETEAGPGADFDVLVISYSKMLRRWTGKAEVRGIYELRGLVCGCDPKLSLFRSC